MNQSAIYRTFAVLVTLAAPALAGAQCDAHWRNLPGASIPAAGYGGAVAYDPTRHMYLMFGGQDAEDLIPDTAAFDGTAWYIVPTTTAPPARMYNRLVYDSRDDVFVMFSGLNYKHAFNDLWEFSPVTMTWRQRFQAGPVPGARWWPAVCYNPDRDTVIMFGGSLGYRVSQFQSNEMWELHDDRWSRIAPASSSPPARTFAAMVYDTDRRLAIMHGGYRMTDDRVMNDTWAWNGTEWRFVCYGPPLRWHAMTYDTARNVTVTIPSELPAGGQTAVWEFDCNRWHEAAVGGPPPRNRGNVCYGDGGTVMLGGYMPDHVAGTAELFDDAWAWRGDCLPTPPPIDRER